MKKLFRGFLLCAGLAAMLLQPTAHADSFQGTFWSLSTDNVDYDAGANKSYQVLLTVDTSGYNGTGLYIDQVAIKVSSELLGASLLSGPGGTSNWTTTLGGIGANGCTGSGSGFDCADSTSNGTFNAVPNGIYSWLFSLQLASDKSLNFGLLGSSVKGRFVDGSGGKVGDLVSENVTLTTPVPEPEIYAMLGIGLGFMGWAARRRKQQAV